MTALQEDHDMRPGCAREFGKIQAEQTREKEFRGDVRRELAAIKLSLDDVSDIKEMLATHVGQADGGWHRIEELEASVKVINGRMWRERVISSGLTGAIIILAQWIMGRASG